MNQQEVEQWIAQQGGQGRVQYSRSTSEVDNPAADPMAAKAAGVPFDPTAPAKVSISEEKWTAYGPDGKPTGAVLHVRRRPDNDFDIIEQQDANPSRPSADQTPAKPPETKDEGGFRWVWEPNPGGPNAGGKWVKAGPAPETPAERQAREANAPTQTVRTETVNGQTFTVITIVPKPGQPGQPGQVVLGPDGQIAPGGIPGKQAVEKRTTITRNGKTFIQVSRENPDGSVSLSFTDQAGNVVTLPDEGNQPLPADMPPFRPDVNHADGAFGVIEYARALQALRSQGKLTDTQFAEFVKLAHEQATSAASRLDTIRGAQAQLQANEIGQRNADLQASISRLNSANTATQNAFQTSQEMASKFTPSSYNATGGPLLPALMAIQDARAGAWGGLEHPARVGVQNYPLLAALQGMGVTPSGAAIPAVAALPGMTGAAPQISAAPTSPNAIGAGAVPGVLTPGPPSGATVNAANQASQAASQAAFGALGVPGGTPSPAPSPPAPAAVNPSASAPTPAAPVAAPSPAALPARDDWRTDPGVTPLPPAPTPDQYQPAQPINMDPRQGPVGMAPVVLPGVLQAGVMSELSGKYPPDVLAEAARMLGWI